MLAPGSWRNFSGANRGTPRRQGQKKKKEREQTNGANDGSTTEVLHGNHVRVELGMPFQLHAVAHMVVGVGDGHFDCRFVLTGDSRYET